MATVIWLKYCKTLSNQSIYHAINQPISQSKRGGLHSISPKQIFFFCLVFDDMFFIVSSVGKTPLEKALQYSKIGTVMFLLQADCQRSPNLIKSEKIRELCTMYPPLTMFMDHEFNQPWSLLRLCRYNIRNAIERDKLKDIPEQLLLPRTLLNYVTLNENV